MSAHPEAGYALSINAQPAIFTWICNEFATNYLNALRPLHDLGFAKELYEKNIAYIQAVTDGKRTHWGQALAVKNSRFGKFDTARRVFSRSRLRGF